jgi:hypothetical protein
MNMTRTKQHRLGRNNIIIPVVGWWNNDHRV